MQNVESLIVHDQSGQLKRSSLKQKNDPNSRIRQARRRWKC